MGTTPEVIKKTTFFGEGIKLTSSKCMVNLRGMSLIIIINALFGLVILIMSRYTDGCFSFRHQHHLLEENLNFDGSVPTMGTQDCHPVLLLNFSPHGCEICLYVQISQYEVGGINWWIKLGLCINLSRLPPLLSRWKQFSCTFLASLFNHQLVDLFQNSSGCSFTYMQRACQTWRVANFGRMVLYQSLYILVCPRHSWCDFMFTAPLMDSEA